MATKTDLPAVPEPINLGAEMKTLGRFLRDVTWTGTIVEGGMGPGTPAMTAISRGQHTSIQDGRWIVGSYEQEQRLLDDAFVLTWQLRWVAGWDPAASTGDGAWSLIEEYRLTPDPDGSSP